LAGLWYAEDIFIAQSIGLRTQYGVDEWPGKRILTEDAIGGDTWQQSFGALAKAAITDESPPALVDESAVVVVPVALFLR
jgi:hypothetical protein